MALQSKTCFNHSTPVPKIYKIASKVARNVKEGKDSLKNLIFQEKHVNIKATYALIVETFKRDAIIKDLIEKSQLLVKEPRLDPWLTKILICELLWGKNKMKGDSKPIQTILGYEKTLRELLQDCNGDLRDVIQHTILKPRYVRVNTLKISMEEAVDNFRDEGWTLVPYFDKSNYDGFLDRLSNLQPHEFMPDLHIPELLIFPPKTEFYRHEAYKSRSIILQDKASCLPVFLLNPTPGSVVLDMCAAPGMKTTQLAAMLKNSGTVYAAELDKNREKLLREFVETSGATCVKTILKDVMKINDAECPNVEYILVDPSCSGSGITDRVEVEDSNFSNKIERLRKLCGFQAKLLRHALTSFPQAKRVIYSTCSLNSEENEDVVRQVLETCKTFKIIDAKKLLKSWNTSSSEFFPKLGELCVYATPDKDKTNGFFVAVFERLEDGEKNEFLNVELCKMFDKSAQFKKRKIDTKEEKPSKDKFKTENISYENKAQVNPKKEYRFSRPILKIENSNDENHSELPLIKKEKEKTNTTHEGTNLETKQLTEMNDVSDAEVKKKKKKKLEEKNGSEENFTNVKIEETPMNLKNARDFEMVFPQSKQKRKRKVEDDSIISLDVKKHDDELSNEHSCSGKKKRHIVNENNKEKNVDGEIKGEIVENNSDEINKKSRKKNKDKHKSSDSKENINNIESGENYIEEVNASITEIPEETLVIGVCDKSNKKKKNHDVEDVNESISEIVNETCVAKVSEKSKKKKRRDVEEMNKSIPEIPNETSVIEVCEKSKKKKKHNVYEVNNSILEIPKESVTEIAEKSKKTKQDVEEINKSNLEINETSVIEVSDKKLKKKKKHDVDEVNKSIIEIPNETFVTEIAKKSKKKTKQHVEEINKSNLETNETSDVKLKKKKKHDVEKVNNSISEIPNETTVIEVSDEKLRKKKKHNVEEMNKSISEIPSATEIAEKSKKKTKQDVEEINKSNIEIPNETTVIEGSDKKLKKKKTKQSVENQDSNLEDVDDMGLKQLKKDKTKHEQKDDDGIGDISTDTPIPSEDVLSKPKKKKKSKESNTDI